MEHFRLTHRLRRFGRDERGVFMVLFGVLALVLVAVAGSVVDYTGLEQMRTRAQQALNSSALGLQSRIYANPPPDAEALRVEAEAVVNERLGNADVRIEVSSAVVSLTSGTLTLSGTMTYPFAFLGLVGVSAMDVPLTAQAAQGGYNLEIAVALDTTGSMDGSRMTDLKSAATDLIDLVVADVQSPVYSKMALVPYSIGVNAGPYADAIRGAITGPSAVMGVAWADGAGRSISAITNESPARIQTSGNHGLQTGDIVAIAGIADNGTRSFARNLNGKYYRVTRVNNTRVTLDGVNSTTYREYGSGGTITRCLSANCELVVSSPSHRFAAGEFAYMRDLVGSLGGDLNGRAFSVVGPTLTGFALGGTYGPDYSAWAGGGRAHCVRSGCDYYRFQNPYGNWRIHAVSTCLSERTDRPYEDLPPSTAPHGLSYPPTGNPCSVRPITPLTSNRQTLKAEVAALAAGGSTGGHVGVGWTWNLLSPEYAYLWPTTLNRPKPYTEPNLLKIAVLMTDGEYNSSYCRGVISQSSTEGSGSLSDQINCNAPNGSSYTQAVAYCSAMKRVGILVYTVGFQIANSQSARDLMAGCATSAQHAYLASSGAELRTAFRAIGNSIKNLRLSQ